MVQTLNRCIQNIQYNKMILRKQIHKKQKLWLAPLLQKKKFVSCIYRLEKLGMVGGHICLYFALFRIRI